MDDDSRKKLLMEWQNKKKEVITHPILKGKGRMGNGSLCSGYVIGEIFKRRFRWLSSIFCGNEVIKSNVSINYL